MKENGKYQLLQCSYYASHCVVLSYAVYYLTIAGLSDRAIGFLVALTCLLSSLFQGAAGRLADRSALFSWKKQLQIYAVLEIILSIILFLPGGSSVTGVIFALLILFSMLMMPMVNAAGFHYKDAEKKVDFGIARGLGSLSYAFTAYLAGKLTAHWGPSMILFLNILASVFLLIVATSMPYIANVHKPSTEPAALKSHKSLIRTYPVFFITAIGAMLFVFFNNMVTIYMLRIMERVGGDSGSMGTALAIAACAELPMLFLYSKLARHVSAPKLIVISGFFFSLKGILFIAAPNVQTIYAVQLLQSVSFGLLVAAKAHYADTCMTEEDKVTGQSVMTMTESMASVLASLTGGLLMGSGGIMLLLWCATGAAIVGTLITGLAAHENCK
ncbi:MAG: MFS transporter [Spirochaetia bacterium]|nr:MFS transporter [Spirochaetia bacterium]